MGRAEVIDGISLRRRMHGGSGRIDSSSAADAPCRRDECGTRSALHAERRRHGRYVGMGVAASWRDSPTGPSAAMYDDLERYLIVACTVITEVPEAVGPCPVAVMAKASLPLNRAFALYS